MARPQPYPAPQHPVASPPPYEGNIPYTYNKGATKSNLQSQVAQTLTKLTEQKYGGGGFTGISGGTASQVFNRHQAFIQQTPPQHESFY